MADWGMRMTLLRRTARRPGAQRVDGNHGSENARDAVPSHALRWGPNAIRNSTGRYKKRRILLAILQIRA